MKNEQGKPNRLIKEKSPYLLQHAYNPVDWHPWGEEAFEKARWEDKPVFVSIGYSTCHWCHVMERETFEDEEAARALNDSFVCVKVDREERPDIDTVYMAVCQALTGSGGWPLSVFLTPDKQPFFAGTYFPKHSLPGRIGMVELSAHIAKLWKSRRGEVLESTGKIVQALENMMAKKDAAGEPPGEDCLHRAYQSLAGRFDAQKGGFGTAPKFPTPHQLTFLLRYWKRTGEGRALKMVEKTLEAMGKGGIYDQIGFGFHRYSTDADWLLPHFEKMLYDQALMAMAFLEAFQATGKKDYAQKAEEIFTYVLRDMTSPEGGFYSAEDADSEGEEGKFYVWGLKEIRGVLGEEDAAVIEAVYNVKEKGNFLDEATRERTGTNILHLTKPPGELAAGLKMDETQLARKLEDIRGRLFAERKKRVPPYKDDKILTDWNGLMIAALAKGGRTLSKERYTEAAEKAARFILSKLTAREGRLLKRYREGSAELPAHADDYAFFIWGLVELYESTFKVEYLKKAVQLSELFLRLFWGKEDEGFYLTAADAEPLPVRPREIYDGALPSANSVAALNLLRLARMTGRSDLEEKAAGIGKAFSAEVNSQPSAYTQYLSALDFLLGPGVEVVLVGEKESPETRAILGKLHQSFTPHKVVLFKNEGNERDEAELQKLAPFTKGQKSLEGKTTAYICRNFACRAPLTEAEKILEHI